MSTAPNQAPIFEKKIDYKNDGKNRKEIEKKLDNDKISYQKIADKVINSETKEYYAEPVYYVACLKELFDQIPNVSKQTPGSDEYLADQQRQIEIVGHIARIVELSVMYGNNYDITGILHSLNEDLKKEKKIDISTYNSSPLDKRDPLNLSTIRQEYLKGYEEKPDAGPFDKFKSFFKLARRNSSDRESEIDFLCGSCKRLEPADKIRAMMLVLEKIKDEKPLGMSSNSSLAKILETRIAEAKVVYPDLKKTEITPDFLKEVILPQHLQNYVDKHMAKTEHGNVI